VGYPTGGPCVTVFHLRLCFHMTSAGAAAALAAATAAAAETKKSTTHIVHTLHDGMATAQHTSSILVGAASTTNNTHRHADRVFNRVADMGPTLAHMHATYTNTCRPGVTTAWPICNQHSGSHSDTNTLFYCTHACSRRQHMQTGCSTAWPTWDQHSYTRTCTLTAPFLHTHIHTTAVSCRHATCAVEQVILALSDFTRADG
jgi:hypothetical protein